MRYLAEHGYSTLSVSDVVRFVRGAAAPRKAVCITFDDGWRSQLLAVPVLRRHGFKATFLLFPERGIDDLLSQMRMPAEDVAEDGHEEEQQREDREEPVVGNRGREVAALKGHCHFWGRHDMVGCEYLRRRRIFRWLFRATDTSEN